MTQILQPYEVSIVNADVEQHETLNDVFYSLERLDSTIDDIFGRVERRITDERSRLDQINNRIANCHAKVNDIRGSKKATTVFSTAKFPAPEKLPAYPTLFSQVSIYRVYIPSVLLFSLFTFLVIVIFYFFPCTIFRIQMTNFHIIFAPLFLSNIYRCL
jgi:hypothetical protein